MNITEKAAKNPRITLAAGGLTVLASTLFIPGIRKGIKYRVNKAFKNVRKSFPRITKIFRKADSPGELKEEVEDEAKEEMADKMREGFKASMRSKVNKASKKLRQNKDENAKKVHSNAEHVKEKAQEGLLKVRDTVATAKEAGEDFQDKVKQKTDSGDTLPGANDMKGANQIKSSVNIKSSTNIKGPGEMKHHTNSG